MSAHESLSLLALAGLAGLVLIAAVLLLTRPYRYRACPLLTPGEKRFASMLAPALPTHVRLLAKIRVADLLQPVQREGSAGRERAFGRIAAKHVDFVLVDAAWTVLMAIELDDSSHDRPDRRRRDAMLDRAFASADLLLHRVRVKKSYREDVAEICALALAERPSADG